MDEFEQLLKIPKERMAILIGTKGEVKAEIEDRTSTKLDISKDGEVTILGESLDAWIAKLIVKAIGRGFSPEKAMNLLKDNYGFELIELKEWAKTDKTMQRLKGRVIGEHGRSKENIERLTDCYISVYGKTIGIIGETIKMLVAKKAVEMLLSGSMHATVFKMLENEHKAWKKEELLGQ